MPMRMCNLALAEMTEAMARGWEGRDSRVVMLLQQERAGIEIAVDPERMKEALAAQGCRGSSSLRSCPRKRASSSSAKELDPRFRGDERNYASLRASRSLIASWIASSSCARSTTGTSIILPSTEIEPRPAATASS